MRPPMFSYLKQPVTVQSCRQVLSMKAPALLGVSCPGSLGGEKVLGVRSSSSVVQGSSVQSNPS